MAASSEGSWGTVEVDETYIGGKAKNRHGGGVGGGKRMHQGGRGPSGKIAVIGAIAHKGKVVARVIERTDAKTLQSFVKESVSKKVKLVATDEYLGYAGMGFPHKSVITAAGSTSTATSTPPTSTRSGPS